MKMRISLNNFPVECLIGCLKEERVSPQILQVDVMLLLDDVACLQGDRVDETWDYTRMAEQVGFILREGRFYLLETAAKFMTRYFLLPSLPDCHRPKIKSVTVRLKKFNILSAGQVFAEIESESTDQDEKYQSQIAPWGWSDLIDENEGLALRRINIKPGSSFLSDCKSSFSQRQYFLSPGLEINQNNDKTEYFNASSSIASLLLMDLSLPEFAHQVTSYNEGTG